MNKSKNMPRKGWIKDNDTSIETKLNRIAKLKFLDKVQQDITNEEFYGQESLEKEPKVTEETKFFLYGSKRESLKIIFKDNFKNLEKLAGNPEDEVREVKWTQEVDRLFMNYLDNKVLKIKQCFGEPKQIRSIFCRVNRRDFIGYWGQHYEFWGRLVRYYRKNNGKVGLITFELYPFKRCAESCMKDRSDLSYSKPISFRDVFYGHNMFGEPISLLKKKFNCL